MRICSLKMDQLEESSSATFFVPRAFKFNFYREKCYYLPNLDFHSPNIECNIRSNYKLYFVRVLNLCEEIGVAGIAVATFETDE